MTVWEPPAYPAATGVWSEFKERCWDPHCQQQLCLQTDVSTARKGEEGNNPSQTTRRLNTINLKLRVTTTEASSRPSSPYDIPTNDAAVSVQVPALFPADHFSCTTNGKPNLASFKVRDEYEYILFPKTGN